MSLIQKHQKIIYQFLRFAGIGFLNTAVDISLFNVLIALTGITVGFALSLLTAVSFTIAAFHSYWWNKFWAFGEANLSIKKFITQLLAAGLLGILIILAAFVGANRESAWPFFAGLFVLLFVAELVLWRAFNLRVTKEAGVKEAGRLAAFMVVSVGGTLINSVLVGVITTYLSPLPGFSDQLWANAAKAVAVAISLIWNFIGYKWMVFKK